MLHPKVISKLKQLIEMKSGVKLVEYPIEKCVKVYDHFASITKSDGKKTWYQRVGQTAEEFKMEKWESDWITNELLMCRCSFEYWLWRYFFLKDIAGYIRRPDPSVAWEVALDILRVIDGQRKPMLLLFLKARQLGISTLVEAIILWIAFFRKGSFCVISSAEEEKSVKMSEMVWRCLDYLPIWMKPVLTGEDKAKGPEFGYIESAISIQHGSMKKGIGRGDTPVAAHLCLRGDSLIDIGDGNLKKIEEIVPGDVVMTHGGHRANVSAISRRPADGRRVVEIRSWLNRERVSITEDHEVFTSDGWVAAGSLTNKHWIGTPIRQIDNKIGFAVTPHSRDKWGRDKCGKSSAMRFDFNRETGFAVGYYLAEGYLGRNPEGPSSIHYSLHQTEGHYAKRAMDALQKYSTSSKLKNRPGTLTAVLGVYGTSLARFFRDTFGDVDQKRIPEWVFLAGREFCEGIVAGYFSGDGSKSYTSHGPMVQATSIRPRLLYQIRHLMASLDIGWGGISFESGFVDKRGWTNQDSWTITISGEAASKVFRLMGLEYKSKNIRDHVKKYRLSDGYLWTRVRSVSESHAEEIWDLEVDHPDHSFETVIGVVANSECAWYPDPINTIESSLFKAMHENKRSFLALESTAKKKGDWWNKLWDYNREMEPQGMNKFVCIFLPWYVGRNIYPTPDWILNHPIPPDWKPNLNTMKQANNAALYVASTPLLRKHMGDKWKMPLEQQWFYEFEYTQAARSDESLKSFLAEMASDEREAFQSKRWAVYSFEVLDRLEKNISKDYVDYAFTGNGIDPRFHLKEFQSHGAKRIHVNTQDMEGKPIEWRLIPLKQTPEDDELSFYVRIWELPKKGYNYTIGIDISGGVGQDATVIDVLRIGKDFEPDVQVAQLWSPYISSPEVPPFAHCLGIFYGQHMSPVPEALMCPETQVATGDPTSHQLSQMGYTNFHYMRRYDMKQHPGNKGKRRGWATLSWSRQMMLETEKLAIDSGWIIVNSERTVQELANQESEEMDSGKTKFDHADGEHDDCIFSLGIAYFCSHDEQALVERASGKKPKVKADAEEAKVEMDSAEAWIARRFAMDDREFMGQEEDEEIPSVW